MIALVPMGTMKTILILLTLLPLASAEFKSEKECVVGAKVADRKNRIGKIIAVNRTMCEVALDEGGKSSYLFWMLHAAGAGVETDDKLSNGTYKCYSSINGQMSYTNNDIQILSADSYENKGKSGKYRVHPSRTILFEDGPLSSYNAKLLAGPKIGLNTNGGNFYATTCDLAGK